MRKVVLGGIVGVLVATAIVAPIMDTEVYANSSQENKIKELEKEKQKLEAEVERVSENKQTTELKLEEVEENQKELEEDMKAIDLEVVEVEGKIVESENEIAKTEKQIKDITERLTMLEEEIQAMQEKIDRRAELIGKRLASLQRSGGMTTFIDVLFGSQSFSDFISRAIALKTLHDHDNALITKQMEEQEAVESNKMEMESQKLELEGREAIIKKQKVELLALQEELQKKSEEKETIMKELKIEHETLVSEQMSAEEEEKILQTQANIVQLVMKEYKENPGALTYYSSNDGEGIFILPAIGRLSSQYGVRSDPFTGEKKGHAGIDIAARTGTPVMAGASGTVTAARYMNGFGNAIFVYHPQYNLTTVYAHLSKIHVEVGQSVEVGEQIGDIGSTGRSTGPHLHFQVHLGQYSTATAVDPIEYLR